MAFAASQPSEERIFQMVKKADILKEEGNSLLKVGDLTKALKKYHHAILHVKGFESNNSMGGALGPMGNSSASETTLSPAKKAALGTFLSVNGNIAVVHTKKGDWEKVIKYCNYVLEKDPQNIKALKRRLKAHAKNDEAASGKGQIPHLLYAENDLAKLVELGVSKQDKSISTIAVYIDARNQMYNKKSKASLQKKLGNFFGGKE